VIGEKETAGARSMGALLALIDDEEKERKGMVEKVECHRMSSRLFCPPAKTIGETGLFLE
jgi:hypothetical protein